MEENYKKEIEEILGEMRCPKDFRCYKSGYENLCKAEDVGLQWFLLCMEAQPQECKFSVLIENKYLCECPLRVYIAKKLKK